MNKIKVTFAPNLAKKISTNFYSVFYFNYQYILKILKKLKLHLHLIWHSGTGLKLFPANTAALPPVFFKNHFKEKISPPAAAAGFCGFIAGTRLITAKPGGGGGR